MSMLTFHQPYQKISEELIYDDHLKNHLIKLEYWSSTMVHTFTTDGINPGQERQRCLDQLDDSCRELHGLLDVNLPALNISMFTQVLHNGIRIKLRVYSNVDFSNNPRNLFILAGGEVVSIITRKSAECVEDKWTPYSSTTFEHSYCYLDIDAIIYHSENTIKLSFATDINVTSSNYFLD